MTRLEAINALQAQLGEFDQISVEAPVDADDISALLRLGAQRAVVIEMLRRHGVGAEIDEQRVGDASIYADERAALEPAS